MVSYDVANGDEIWRIKGLTYQVKSVPVIEDGILYFNGWAPGGEPAVRLVLPDFPEMLSRFDTDNDKRLSKAEIPKEWHPGNWAMQDLNKDTVFDARDWKYYQSRRTSTNATMAVRLGGQGDVTGTHVLWRYRKTLPDVPSVLHVPRCAVHGQEGRHRDDAGPEDGQGAQAGAPDGSAR